MGAPFPVCGRHFPEMWDGWWALAAIRASDLRGRGKTRRSRGPVLAASNCHGVGLPHQDTSRGHWYLVHAETSTYLLPHCIFPLAVVLWTRIFTASCSSGRALTLACYEEGMSVTALGIPKRPLLARRWLRPGSWRQRPPVDTNQTVAAPVLSGAAAHRVRLSYSTLWRPGTNSRRLSRADMII